MICSFYFVFFSHPCFILFSPVFDVGEFICRPFVRFIPKSVSPNQITFFNHLCIWLMVLLAFTWDQFPEHLQIPVIFTASCINFLCMMLDCLDGMHARASNQCSKLGELLDHWFDALHTPLISAGVTYCLFPDPYIAALAHLLNIGVYSTQIILFYHTGKFIHASGVEGQIGVSFVYFMKCVSLLFVNDPVTVKMCGNILISLGVLSIIIIISTFVRQFNFEMWKRQTEYWIILAFFGYMYVDGAIGMRALFIITSIISFRLTGSYVLSAICRIDYSGRDFAIYVWMCVFFWFHYACGPIPLNFLVNKIGSGDMLSGITLQDLLPFIFSFYFMTRNFNTMRNHLPLVKSLDSKQK